MNCCFLHNSSFASLFSLTAIICLFAGKGVKVFLNITQQLIMDYN